MSANLIVDLNGTAQPSQSLPASQAQLSPSGQICGLSGTQIGQSIDMINSDTYCQLWIGGAAVNASGPLILQVQTSDTDVSGNYQDPTSGLQTFPTVFASGGLVYLGSGAGGTWNAFASGQSLQSGFLAFAAFQRPSAVPYASGGGGRYARVNVLACSYIGNLQAGFIAGFKTTGSGGGFSFSPLPNSPVNV